MRRIQRELRERPDSGYLGGVDSPGVQVQYWKSLDHLLAYAHDRSGRHFPAWADFNRRVRGSGVVGVWHETYSVAAGAFETVYVNMAPVGLGAATGVVPATGAMKTARGRLARQAPGRPSEAPNGAARRLSIAPAPSSRHHAGTGT
jgi:hypothetical protein